VLTQLVKGPFALRSLGSGRVEGLRAYQLPVLGLTIAILNLKVWQPGKVAWFAMEIDYYSEAPTADEPFKKTWPLRDTGVLNRQDGTWIQVNWHESMREPIRPLAVKHEAIPTEAGLHPVKVNLTGEWAIQEEDKAYQATLDAKVNGPYFLA